MVSFPVLTDTTLFCPAPHDPAHDAELLAILYKNPLFTSGRTTSFFASRQQLYDRALQVDDALAAASRDHGLDRRDAERLRDLAGEESPGVLTHVMFLPMVEAHAGDCAVKRKVVRDALAGRVVGCYASTEIGHGSNVRALETTATYVGAAPDPAADGCLLRLDTPTKSATKFWVGALGCTATYAIVFAQLVDGAGARRGIVPFLVRIRDDALRPLPGVTVGDIGPKLGFQPVDNGFMSLHNVVVPASAMLSTGASMTADGVYTPPPPKMMFATLFGLLSARTSIVGSAGRTVAHGACIAVRYSAVRRQFGAAGKETPVLNYASQYTRLMRAVATSYAFVLAGRGVSAMVQDVQASVSRGDAPPKAAVAAVHSLVSGLKAFVTAAGTAALDACRLCCGGHGYSVFSGLPHLVNTFTHLQTADGENFIMTQQLGRHLLRAAVGDANYGIGHASHLLGVAAAPNAAAAGEDTDRAPLRFEDATCQQRLLRCAATAAVTSLAQHMAARADDTSAAWSDALMTVKALSDIHCAAFVHQQFRQAVDALDAADVRDALRPLVTVFGLTWVETAAPWLYDGGHLRPGDLPALQAALQRAAGAARKNAVPLVDAWGFTDLQLRSALGRHDGRYEDAMLACAELSPVKHPRSRL